MILISIVTVGCILVLVLAREKIVSLYTDDEDIQLKAIHALAVFCIALVPDSVIYSQMGVFRGLGQQKIAAAVSIGTLVTISIPLGCLFAYVCGLDISGFWLGYAVRALVAASILWYVLWYKFDWELIAKEAQEREEK
jgi:Na+-driven multidrug efflux pump